jgi:RNA recognition motif-containing protein
MTKLYIGNLPYTTTEDDLKNLFADYGTVLSATIITDRDSGRSKGFGFIELEDDAKALEAITASGVRSHGVFFTCVGHNLPELIRISYNAFDPCI